MTKVYTYAKCSTCRKAVKYLQARGLAFKEIPIRETPPNRPELKRMLKQYGGDLRRLFNTSGGDYRSLELKSKLPGMTVNEALALLETNGNLVKRPFLLTQSACAVGFNEAEWDEVLAE